jgi:hypothetical protein
LHKQPPQIGIPSLSNRSQSHLATRATLRWDQTDPGGHLSTIFKVCGTRHRGDHGAGGDRTNPTKRAKALRRFALLGMDANLHIAPPDALLELVQLLLSFDELRTNPRREPLIVL